MTRGAPWFVTDFLPRWLGRAMMPDGSVIEALNLAGEAEKLAPTTLTQARTVFALSHLYLATRDDRLRQAALAVYGFMDGALRDKDGGYRQSTQNALRRSYDQSFALLALTTLQRIEPGAVPESRITDLWHFTQTTLTEPATGALWEDDAMAATGAVPDALRAQNPHMHMLEATLQALEMTGDPAWLDRATHLVQCAARHFIDPATGAIREFVGPDLAPLATPKGARREPGHQYEWAWLLQRYADFGGDAAARVMADRMIAFVTARGLRRDGPMAGTPFDALDATGAQTEATHLLWPLTEAGKYHAATGAADRTRAIETLIFKHYFAGGPVPVWCNQLDGAGRILWPAALSRLIYHVALFVTEGADAGLWQLEALPDTTHHEEETTP
ncbi:AGE family epimerase/isomerase [Loktanella sp. M215]|uniref:AGE family epimerase/isomerase n=1 Tax=Loktanella sp. M215 TaxID=2675431 RepID=UPI001F1945AA|nr:AGE family epimerase/isomerase [Loktanella sp. M215]MCF7701771.1 hypothetical protein [Loktanella sp. M215]